MSDLLLDVKFALRTLRQRPLYTVVAILTLALGIGATTAIFTVVQGVLLDPLPYPDSHELMIVQESNPPAGFGRFSISPPNFHDYRAMNQSFESMAAATGASLSLVPDDGGPAVRLNGRAVTHEFFRVFGVAPAVGRDFLESDDQPEAAPVVIVTHETWQQLGGDEALVGDFLRLDGEAYEVIGVLPQGIFEERDVYVPLGVDYAEAGRGAHWLTGFGRLAEGETVESARADLQRVAAALEAEYPESNTDWTSVVDPLLGRVVEDVETALWVLFGAVLVVLLIACSNIAHLTLARLSQRDREVALRSALGAGRVRLLRQLLTESVLLSTVAGGLGVALAHYGTKLLLSINADEIPRTESIGLDAPVLAFALALTLVTAVLFGLVPALQASRPDLAGTLKEGGRGQAGAGGTRLRRLLVVAEVAMAMVLTVGAGLLLRSYANLLQVDSGIDPQGVWTATFELPEGSYGEDAEVASFLDRLLEEARALPGVESATTAMPMPLSGGGYFLSFFIDGQPAASYADAPSSAICIVSDDAFETLRIPILRGRGVTAQDRAESHRVIAVSESAARTFWPDSEAIGQRISFAPPDHEDAEWFEVVGIVGDVRHQGMDRDGAPTFYIPVQQFAQRYATVALRTDGDPTALAGSLREAVRRLDPALALFDEQPAETLVEDSLAGSRFNATLLGTFAGLALVLAIVGVFGVVHYTVAQQMREIGVRVALGASVREVVGWVFGRGLGPVGWGVLLGLGVSIASARVLDSLVFGIPSIDPVTLSAVGLILVGCAAVACLLPAWSAARVDPAIILRDE